jgi:hypothetical protein
MLPLKIKDLINKLFNETSLGKITWSCSYDSISYQGKNNTIYITYHFNYIEELGNYIITIKPGNNKDYCFNVLSNDKDYEILRSLFEASNKCIIDLDIDNF